MYRRIKAHDLIFVAVFSTGGFSHPPKHHCCLGRQVIIDRVCVCVWVCVPVKCQAACLEEWRSWEPAATQRIPGRNTPFFVCPLKPPQKAPVALTGLAGTCQYCLFWFWGEIRLITPAARCRNWGQVKTSNKNLWLQEIWMATAASDSCPSKLDCVLRGDCTHEQSRLWWACQMTLIADHKMDWVHCQKWPTPIPPHPFQLKILLTMRWETTRRSQQLLRSGIKPYRMFWLVGIWEEASWVKKQAESIQRPAVCLSVFV